MVMRIPLCEVKELIEFFLIDISCFFLPSTAATASAAA